MSAPADGAGLRRLGIALGIAGLAIAGFFWFPGHTYLQSDTQIYVPLLERLWDQSLFEKDLLTSRPHLAYTVYDEAAFVLRRVFGLPFHYILEAAQIVFRALGLWGIFLAATAMGLERRFAFAVTALFGLGAVIAGPAVLTFEYEPVPRGFALSLLFCAIGLAMHSRLEASALVASIAFLYHAPTTLPFWMVLGLVSYRIGRSTARAWIPLAAAVICILVLARLQPGISERQVFFGRIDPALEHIQRIRAPYNWIGLWPGTVFWHYGVLAAATALAVWRVRIGGIPRDFLLGLTAIGLLGIPCSFMLLDMWKWALMPQLQPARAVLFVTAMAVLACSVAAMQAVRRGRWIEGGAWLLVPIAIPLHKSVLPLVTFNLVDPLTAREAVVLFGFAPVLAAGLAAASARRQLTPALAAAVALVYAGLPAAGGVHNYPRLSTPDLVALSAWARGTTPKNALFHFQQAGHELYPGIFRAEALRAVYVDWKAGGQVNYFKSLGEEWWLRWQETMLLYPGPAELKQRGVDYVVAKTASGWRGGTLVYSNGSYAVYRL